MRIKSYTCITNYRSMTMKLRKILKSMWANYCNTFKDVPPGAMF